MSDWFRSALLRVSLIGITGVVAGACIERTTLPLSKQSTQAATVFFGSGDNKFYAVDALTGSQRWQVTNQEKIISPPRVSDGIVYALSEHQLYATDAETGQKRWTFSSEDVGLNAKFTLTVSEGAVYFVGNYGRKLYALDAATGRKKWAISAPGFTTTNSTNSYGEPMAANGKVYIGSSTTALYVLNAQTGLLEQELTVGQYTYGAPFLANGVLYVGSYDGKLYAFNATTGQQKWISNLGGWLVYVKLIGQTLYVNNWQEVFALDVNTGIQQWRFKPAGSGNTVARSISGGIVYGAYSLLDSRDASIYALDATTGTKKWATWTWPGGFIEASRPVVANGLLYAAGRDNRLYALDATTGTTRWSMPISDIVTSSLCVLTEEGDHF